MLHVPKDLKIIVLRSYWYQTFSSKFHKQYYPIKYQYFEKGISSFITPFYSIYKYQFTYKIVIHINILKSKIFKNFKAKFMISHLSDF